MSRIYNQSYLLKKLGAPTLIEKTLITIDTPFEFVLAWDKKTKINKIRAHSVCATDLKLALDTIASKIKFEKLKLVGFNEFGGGFQIRNMRGGTTLSAHAFGIAFDFAPIQNALNTSYANSSMSSVIGQDISQIFLDHNFINYGLNFGYDSMHFEYAKIL